MAYSIINANVNEHTTRMYVEFLSITILNASTEYALNGNTNCSISIMAVYIIVLYLNLLEDTL